MDASSCSISAAMMMTASLPPSVLMTEVNGKHETNGKPEIVNGKSDYGDDLDRLGSRLEKFVQGAAAHDRKRNSTSPIQPTPRKNSAGSQIPKPEISPKPAFLLYKVGATNNVMAQSLRQDNN